jgi:hypothetical protein
MKQRKRSSYRVDGTFDIECAQWSRVVLVVTRHRTDGVEVHRTMRAAVERMLKLGGTWWSHNGGTYDSIAAIEELRQLGVTMSISLSGSRISRAVGGGLTLCDSYAVIPLGLDAAAGIAGVAPPVLGWTCECGSNCGGYCSIRVSMDETRRAQLAEYCVADTGVLLDVLDALDTYTARHDLDLRGTIGGSAWATARRVLGLPDADFAAATWKRIRSGYHGGRVSVFRPHAKVGRHWDLSAAYPAALAKTRLPVGECTEYGAASARRCLGNRRPGIYACTVRIPPCHVPPMPWTWRGGTAYPVGDVSGVWTLPELDAAILRDCVILDVQWCVVWSEESLVFGTLMRDWTDLRFAAGKSSALGAWLRLYPNSITGKLAEQPNRRFVRLHPDLASIKMCLGVAPCTRDRCTQACDSWRQLDQWGEMWTVPYYRQSSSAYIQWAAYTTAVTRVAWLDGAESQGDGLVYGDTDSLWTTSRHRPYPDGDGLGEWSLKHTWADWECAAPKSYAFVDGHTGELTVRSAGARLRVSEWQEGSAAQDRGVVTLVEAAQSMTDRRGLFRSKHHTWSRPTGGTTTGWYGDRLLDPDTQTTQAMTCEQLYQRHKSQAR